MDMCSRVPDVHNNLLSNLESTSHESLHVDDALKSELATEGNGVCDVGEENLSGGVKQQETKLNMICLTKSATFPIPHMMSSSSSDEEANSSVAKSNSEQSASQTYSRSVSLPAPELIPALKGSREKYRGSPMKLTVKWAPDVYDPVPTLMSHTVKNKKQQKSRKKKKYEKKNGKKGQKGNSSSHGGSGKDKKQARKQGGHSDLSFESLDSHDNVTGTSELDALDVRSHDSFCGTSFLKNSVTKVHSLVAEAQ
ncbi:uncharacterized protein LOC130730433 [Lotus japonicus]|uniref:uncharacterized protein LOC130730433 n=1 Tax=Lotus japonicus TaxID=34305 RepID=UPI0025825FE4|nr:uncharacterized protein LOC130730433 [Lotus japonicus]